MILFELLGTEANPVYQDLEISNGNRQYDFLRSVVLTAIAANARFLSQQLIKALNFHAIACLHVNAGEYRPWGVMVGDYEPPPHYRVQALMDDFVNRVNRHWAEFDPVVLAAYVLWRMNNIHPFINGNGRTARAASYFVLCLKSGGLLPGATILPELIKQNRPAYVAALKQVDASAAPGVLDLSPLHNLLQTLLEQQLASAAAPEPAADPQPQQQP